MRKRTLLAAALLATSAIAAQAAELILYESPGFSGRQLTLRGYMPDINSFGFNDRASSLTVRSGVWEVCTDAEFRGFCATLQPGEYRILDPRFNDRISSAREVTQAAADLTVPRNEPPRYEPPRYESRGAIELFGQSGFRGRSVIVDRSLSSLDEVGFNDRATSLIVREGTWQLCSDGGFSGTCRVFEPGRYADIGPGLAREISSARLIDGIPAQGQPVPAPAQLPAPEIPRIVLFDSDSFRGRSLAVTDDLSDLRRSSFNDDTASIMIESGNWEVCTDAYYRGQCRVLSPGQYRRLDPTMHRSISSVRPAGLAADPRYRVASVELFAGPNFDGSRIAAANDVPNLDARGFNDRASSMIIHEGRWEVCADAGYNGRCAVFGPGRYSDLSRLNNEVSSLRRVN